MSKRHRTLGIVVVVIGALVGGIAVDRGLGHTPAGPLADPTMAGAASQRADLGARYSFGPLVVTNTSGERLTLDGFGPTETPKGLAVVGSYAMRSLGGRIMIIHGFPANGVAQPRYRIRGLVLPPHSHGYELVLGVRTSRRGRATFPRLQLTYHSAGKRYRALYDLSLTMCAPVAAFPICRPVH